MKRRHLFEWEDQPWLPHVFRDYITDHLRFALESNAVAEMHRAIAIRLKKAMEHLDTREIVDLCSGGGGPIRAVQRRLASEMAFPALVTLTDLYPNVSAFRRIEAEGDGEIRCRYDSISVFDVPADLRGIRTLFTALHHFRPADARHILADAANKGVGVAVFEPLERTLRTIVLVGLAAVIRALVLTPWVGQLSLRRVLFTYVVPLGPIIAAWDGMVSALRTYSVEELRELTVGLDQGFSWDIQRIEVPTLFGRMPLTYLIGLPDRA
jgi:hypothetical protein